MRRASLPGWAAKALALVPLCLLGLLALLALCFLALPLLPTHGQLNRLGIFIGMAFLLLCIPVPVCGITCGIASLCLCRGRQAMPLWRVLAILDIVLGALTAVPCLLLFLAAISGQV